MPTAPTISSVMAGLQVQLAIKHLHGAEIPNYCRFMYHGYIDEFDRVFFSRNPECPTHALYENEIVTSENLIGLDRGTKELTGSQFLDIVRGRLGEKAEVSLGFDLIPEAYCPTCGAATPLFKQRGMVYKDEAECPTCLAAGRSGKEALRRLAFVNLLTGKEKFLHLPLAEMGIPPLHILKGQLYNEETEDIRTLYFEFSGDARSVWEAEG
jgi:adenylyltransferase/sulfurtransferase